MVHSPVPEQSCDHPANVEPGAGVAVRVTTVPKGKNELHVVPHWMGPDTELTVEETSPWPLPSLVTSMPTWARAGNPASASPTAARIRNSVGFMGEILADGKRAAKAALSLPSPCPLPGERESRPRASGRPCRS